ncbi:MAG: hypothetical protein E7556_08410 [Ruminococcaceae bacterium]|nr:hypothetical protein [Oscillospiraceae bacterium]
MKKGKWELEPIVKKVCLVTTIFYGIIIALVGLMYLLPNLPFVNKGFIDYFVSIIFLIVMAVVFLHYQTNIGFVLPIIITVFLVIVSFIGFIKRKNPRVFVHPLVLSSIVTSFVGTGFIMCFVERIENGF